VVLRVDVEAGDFVATELRERDQRVVVVQAKQREERGIRDLRRLLALAVVLGLRNMARSSAVLPAANAAANTRAWVRVRPSVSHLFMRHDRKRPVR
jgi:hypothetical protein